MGSSNMNIESKVADKDIVFKGIDGSSDVTALTLDMSDAGAAIFNNTITLNGILTSNANGTGGTKATLADFTSSGSIRSILLKGAENTANQVFLDVVKDINGTETTLFSIADTNIGIAAGNLYVSSEGTSLNNNGNQNGNYIANNGQSFSSRAATNNQTHKTFYNPNGAVGSITTNGSVTYYNTSSDYRLKENVVTDWDGTTLLKQLKPSKFNFKADKDTTIQGFLAHEVSSIVPEAVSGDKDDVFTAQDETDGLGTEGQPKYQGIDQAKLVPLLVKTIQELETRIKTLEDS